MARFSVPCCAASDHRKRLPGLVSAAAFVVAAFAPCIAFADVQPITQEGGPPNLPIPVYSETGLPDFKMPVGKQSGLPPAAGGTGTSDPVATGDTAADATLASRSWGALAAANSTALGVSPTALAATCVMESGCKDMAGPNTVSGAFQMTNATYTQDINKAYNQNPSLAASMDTSLAGKRDPANEAIAAAQDLKTAALSLQSSGIANPTVLDARAVYQWGAGAGPGVARARDDADISVILSPYYGTVDLQKNGVLPGSTVGQWRQTIINKVGSAANQKILQ